MAVGNEKNFTGQRQAIVLGRSPGKKRGCQGASAYQLQRRGPDMPNLKRGDPGKGGKMPIPVPLLEFSISRSTN